MSFLHLSCSAVMDSRRYAGYECSTNIPQRQSTQVEVVAIFVMDTEIREIY